jgi:predicted dehydrogenase
MNKIRLGVVGLGHRGHAMFKWVSEGIEGVEAVAACDLNADLWFKDTATYYGGYQEALAKTMSQVKFYDDYETMINEADLDVVMVETPATCHAQFCAKALAKGINVYSDIPTISSLEEADMLWKVVNESDKILMTGATTLGWGFVLAMQDIYRQGLLGNPYYLEAEYIHDCRMLWEESPWRKGNIPITYCTHSLGPLLSIMEEDLRTVSCVDTGSHATGFPECHDLMTAHFTTDSNVVVRLTCSFINNCKTGNHTYRVFGTEGYLEHLSERGSQPPKTSFSSNKLYATHTLTEIPIGFTPHEIKERQKVNPHAGFGHGGADSYLWQLFANALRCGDKIAPVTFKEGLRMTIPGIFAAESAKRGGEVMKIKYPWDSDFKG